MNNCSNSDNISNKLNFYVDIDCLRKFCGIYILYTFSLFITNYHVQLREQRIRPKEQPQCGADQGETSIVPSSHGWCAGI